MKKYTFSCKFTDGTEYEKSYVCETLYAGLRNFYFSFADLEKTVENLADINYKEEDIYAQP